jgi:hypothetical protein
MEAGGIPESLELANGPLSLYDNYVKSKPPLKAVSGLGKIDLATSNDIHCDRYSHSYHVCMKRPLFSAYSPLYGLYIKCPAMAVDIGLRLYYAYLKLLCDSSACSALCCDSLDTRTSTQEYKLVMTMFTRRCGNLAPRRGNWM